MQRGYLENIVKQSITKKKTFDILIVDDDIDASELFKSILELRGHNVVSLNEGVSCISSCKDREFDIIFMDYHICDIDGITLTDFLKDIYKTNSLIFAYTGDSSAEALNNFKKTGMTGALIKPVNMDIFNNIMSTLEERGCIDKNIFNKLVKKSKGGFLLF